MNNFLKGKPAIVTISLIVALLSCGKDRSLLQQKKHFDQELKLWTTTFNHFNLADFKMDTVLHIETGSPQDFNEYKKFMSIYKPIITFAPDSSKFIDLYSIQLNLQQVGDHYEASPDVDQAVTLCDPQHKYWERIYSGGTGQWIEEATWLSKTTFILAGIYKDTADKRLPVILLGDTEKQTMEEYVNANPQCFQNDAGYTSPMLKKLKIEGL